MYIRNSWKYKKKINIIQPGEFYVSRDDELIGTLLGSCVSVCLYDPGSKISGMNHYMLPGRISECDIFADRSARYGITAINRLIKEIEKFGVVRENLIAKLFGGGHILCDDNNQITIPLDNIRLAKVMLEIEDIQMDEIDVGDRYTRKLLMDVKSGKVYLKRITADNISKEVGERDKNFAIKAFRGNE